VTAIRSRPLPVSFLLTLCLATAAQADGHDEPILVQPGAPGEETRTLSAEEALGVAVTGYTREDVDFMQGMIPHHQQAVEMSELVEDRTANTQITDIAGRILASQSDEIEFMQSWLEERGETAGDPMAHHGDHSMHEMPKMEGMATPEQMEELAASEGPAFEALFYELMINHHRGAITMVDDLLNAEGSAYDPKLYEFVKDVKADQDAEIKKMSALLRELSEDPRATLAAGFLDAEQAISNMTLVASLPKPEGFYDPNNPAELSQSRLDEIAKAEEEEAIEGDDEEAEGEDDEEETSSSDRRPRFLGFANTDMAFSGDVLVTGSYHGFNVYRLGDDGVPSLMSSIVCPGGQGDVSIVGDILIMSVEEGRGRLDCGLQGINEDVSDERFRGIRIFDIADLERPKQVGAVQTCRGSHTHSVVEETASSIIVYNSGTSYVRDEEELPGCVRGVPGDESTALFSIDVIEIPKKDPSKARIIDSPAVFADEKTGALAGLWRGGDHGDDTQRTAVTDQCHDITVFPAENIAAGACSGNGIILDISNPRRPKRIDDVTDKGFAYWHSATFNNDGTKVVFTDEWGGGGRPRCRAYDPETWGANAIYDIVEDKLVFRSHYKVPAPQGPTENCVAHNGSIIPVPGRDLFVQAWYQGGISIMDFTDSSNPIEIAYFDRGPIDEEELIVGGYWSTYFYNGAIYGTEIARGLDVLKLEPSEHLTANEIMAANLAMQGGVFNPQQQVPVSWPARPVVAKAYIDQIKREGVMSSDMIEAVEAVVAKVETAMENGGVDRSLSRELKSMAGRVAKQHIELADTLRGMAG